MSDEKRAPPMKSEIDLELAGFEELTGEENVYSGDIGWLKMEQQKRLVRNRQ